jgi:hypothetical protein
MEKKKLQTNFCRTVSFLRDDRLADSDKRWSFQEAQLKGLSLRKRKRSTKFEGRAAVEFFGQTFFKSSCAICRLLQSVKKALGEC